MLERLVRQVGENPQLDQWDPPLCGDIDIRIDGDGVWHCQGTPFPRPALVQLFASVLRAEADGHHYLVTPVEKWRIQVEDVAFVLTDLVLEGGQWWLVGSAGLRCPVTAEHPWQLRDGVPYVALWHGTWGKLARPLYYRLAEQVALNQQEYGVWLGSQWCVLGEKE
ncbi:DUF1285 domain-containing protein [Ferrimonas balearica]|uniref:DUF1285 domain-containing protein n=1 Tax=Ferrimonas balearica TaxID=44012 RepID=UPI001F3AD6E3|nr:DUF1285 domain-containing protein [Ferrimonas balearica]MBY6016879.1 DUF1285 domain-containing protein [Halomonas denitrificans]MBY6093151.1 DUF1285 domain-containing protein [Ferrimonas balearica]